VHGASETVAASPAGVAEAQVLDVRRGRMFDRVETVNPGAKW